MRAIPSALAVVLGSLVLGGCGQRGTDWSASENLLLREEKAEENEAVKLTYWSLIDGSCQVLYDVLADVEHYPEFIPRVDRTQIVDQSERTKTVLIAQRVISSQSSAKVEWTFEPPHRIAFRTLTSDLAFNDGSYEFEPSPDGKRCLVKSTFLVRQGEGRGQSVPMTVLAQATRDNFLAAAGGVKKRAAAKP